jgi:hypothetical protein
MGLGASVRGERHGLWRFSLLETCDSHEAVYFPHNGVGIMGIIPP